MIFVWTADNDTRGSLIDARSMEEAVRRVIGARVEGGYTVDEAIERLRDGRDEVMETEILSCSAHHCQILPEDLLEDLGCS